MLPAWVGGLVLSVALLSFILLIAFTGQWTKRQALHPDQGLVSAYKSQPWWSLACSFFAAAFGCSALSANPEAGATGGWVSVVCYGFANAAPYWILINVGPKLQAFLKMEGFSIADFVWKRFGRPMHICATVLSLFFMFIWLSAELTSAGGAFQTLCPDLPTWVAPLCICLGTAVYALSAGFKASIFTDRIQAPLAVLFLTVLICGIAVSHFHLLIEPGNQVNVRVSREALAQASRYHGEDWIGGIVLILSTTTNQFLDLGSWQRVFASETKRDAQLGLFSAGLVNFVCQAAMASLGVVAMAAHYSGLLEIQPGLEYNSFYQILTITPKTFSTIALLMAVVLAASTVDSLQNAFAAAFAGELVRRRRSLHWSRLIAIVVSILTMLLPHDEIQFIIPAMLLSLTEQSVISLFLLSNIFSLAIIPPIFLGLSPDLATPLGALLGFISGALTVFIVGFAYTRSFVGEDETARLKITKSTSGGLEWPMFPEGFGHWSTLMTFLIVPVVSSVSFWQNSSAPSKNSDCDNGLCEIPASARPRS